MTFESGRKKTGGKKKGTSNKATANAREAIAAFVNNNTHRLERLLDEIEANSPKDAFDAITKVMEYHLPKLARSDNTIEHSVDDTLAGILLDIDGRSANLPREDNIKNDVTKGE